MFARWLALAAAVFSLWALFARDSGAGGPDRAYRVRPGESLWSIAVARIPGDPRRGVWELRQRNGLADSVIQPGQLLMLPSP